MLRPFSECDLFQTHVASFPAVENEKSIVLKQHSAARRTRPTHPRSQANSRWKTVIRVTANRSQPPSRNALSATREMSPHRADRAPAKFPKRVPVPDASVRPSHQKRIASLYVAPVATDQNSSSSDAHVLDPIHHRRDRGLATPIGGNRANSTTVTRHASRPPPKPSRRSSQPSPCHRRRSRCDGERRQPALCPDTPPV